MVKKRIAQALDTRTDKILIFVFPLFLTLLNSNWTFTPATDFLPDPWFYLGYFRYFYEYAPAYPSNVHYFVERITWNVPGYYVYQVLPPLQANYVLHLLVCYMALFSLYGTLNMLFGRRSAFLTTLLMSGYPWFLRAVGWDYVDGIGIAQMLLLIYLLTKAGTSQRWKVYLFFAGVVHTSLLITNLFWAGFALSWFVYFAMINQSISRERERVTVYFFLLGNLVLVIAGAIFYFSVTDSYLFLQNSIALSTHLSGNQDIIQFITDYYGIMPPYWHVLAALVAAISIPRLIRPARNTHYSFEALTVLFVFAYGWLIFWHFYSLPYLSVFLYSSFAIPAIFLLLGALLDDVVNNLSSNLFRAASFSTIVSLALIFRLVVIFPELEHLQGNQGLILLFSLPLFLLLWTRQREKVILPVILSFGVLFFLTASNSHVLLSNPNKGEDNFMAIIEASDTIDTYYPGHDYDDFRLWYRKDINYNTFFDLSALYLYPWGSAIDNPVSGKIPSSVLSLSKFDKLQDGNNIVIVSSNLQADEVMAEANRALSERDANIVLEAEKVIRRGPLHFKLYFTRVRLAGNG